MVRPGVQHRRQQVSPGRGDRVSDHREASELAPRKAPRSRRGERRRMNGSVGARVHRRVRVASPAIRNRARFCANHSHSCESAKIRLVPAPRADIPIPLPNLWNRIAIGDANAPRGAIGREFSVPHSTARPLHCSRAPPVRLVGSTRSPCAGELFRASPRRTTTCRRQRLQE